MYMYVCILGVANVTIYFSIIITIFHPPKFIINKILKMLYIKIKIIF